MAEVFRMNHRLQSEMRRRCINTLTAVDAAAILDEAGLLADSPDRPGRDLRRLLRDGKINGARQLPNRRWFIDRALLPGDRVQLRTSDNESEVGIVLCCWIDEMLQVQDNYVAVFGPSFPHGKPASKPYVLRYLSSSLTLIDDNLAE
ncbi:hypothetical protein OT109_05785 [Phycisphaeraceae bacterium D3-23]